MAYLVSEIPSGLINWINNIFTTSQAGTSIVWVFKDGAEITSANYTYIWSTLTFTVAPSYSVSIVYIVWTGFALSDGELLIPNSPLSGTINWVNKTFTVWSGWIKQVLSVVYDWVETRDFSFVPGSTTITFTYAPTQSGSPIYVDYITYSSTGSDNNFSGNASQADLIDRIYNDILHEKTTSTVFRLDSTKKMINEIQDAICKGWYSDLNWVTYKAPNLTFLNKRSFYKVYANKNIELDANPGSTSLKFTNDYPSTWTLLVNGNIVTYSGNDWITVTWVVWLNTSVSAQDSVQLIYALPVEIYKNFSVKLHQSGVEYIIDEVDSRDNITKTWYNKNWYFITEDYYNNKFIGFTWIGNYSTWADSLKIEMNYARLSPDITASVNSIIPNPYAITILPNLVCTRRLITGDESTKAKNLEVLWVNEMKRLYENYATKTKEFKWKIESDSTNFLYNY